MDEISEKEKRVDGLSRLASLQAEIKAPKSKYNSFGKYYYRSCEDILEAAKPLLAGRNFSLVIEDDVVNVGGKNYIKATCTIFDNLYGTALVSASALAREAETKKGMDEAQISGCASSYARKYALNGLFLLDDSKDSDTDEYASQTASRPAAKPAAKGDDGITLKQIFESGLFSAEEHDECQRKYQNGVSMEAILASMIPEYKKRLAAK